MGTPLGPKYIPYTYMDPLGLFKWNPQDLAADSGLGFRGSSCAPTTFGAHFSKAEV